MKELDTEKAVKKELDIENNFIRLLQEELKYTYRNDIHDRESLNNNFREKFNTLNNINLTDKEFDRLKEEIITKDVFEASKMLRSINTFQRDDNTTISYKLVNTDDWCKNDFEVVNQLQINTRNSHHRYDVIILANGIPIVQIELKSTQISPKKAMEQIVRYKNDKGNGYTNSLLCFMQLFIVSNENNTYYFANNDEEHFKFDAEERFLPIYQMAHRDNKKITHLKEFSKHLLDKCTLGQLISRYMVLVEVERKIMIMRPYQIYAVKAIVDCINQNRGNGYIWHTTGSGKTLTSFKASTLLKDNPDIEKCLFVVDRKDLDRQTREEFNKFQEGCVEENTNTETLVRRLLSTDYSNKVIVTTIQKLGLALNEDSKRNKQNKEKGRETFKQRLKPLSDKRLVIIFDECHRSQFGDNHKAIKEFFPKSQLFGFTGTPIFEENATAKEIDGIQASYKTTKDIFEKLLHAYTITNAIDDGNVLRFHVDYFKPENEEKIKNNKELEKKAIIEAIIEKHGSITDSRRFNAIFATASINNAIEYYELFKEYQEHKIQEDKDFKPLNIACVFSPPANGNKDIIQIQEDLPQEKLDNQQEPEKKKKALTNIINDYNKQYGTNHKINDFDLYYQDVQQRIKYQKYNNSDYPHEKKIDITIVVDMLLTGFDSKYLNTLYVDKNLKNHGLIQAFSRTNRVLNMTKPYGNILDFRGQKEEVDNAITLFSGEHGKKAKEIWLVDPAPQVVKKLDKAVEEFKNFMQEQNLECKPEDVSNLKGDIARATFINKFKEVQKLSKQLEQYTELSEEDSKKIEKLLPKEDMVGFHRAYLDVAQDLKERERKNETDENADIDQLEFEFVLFSSAIIDYDYIMSLISKYTSAEPKKQKVNRKQLVDLLCSNANLMEERDDIIEFIDTLVSGKILNEHEIKEQYEQFKKEKSTKDLQRIANKYGIEIKSLQNFVDKIIDRLVFDGDKLRDLVEPLELSWKERTKVEKDIMKEIIPILKKLAKGLDISGLGAYEQK